MQKNLRMSKKSSTFAPAFDGRHNKYGGIAQLVRAHDS